MSTCSGHFLFWWTFFLCNTFANNLLNAIKHLRQNRGIQIVDAMKQTFDCSSISPRSTSVLKLESRYNMEKRACSNCGNKFFLNQLRTQRAVRRPDGSVKLVWYSSPRCKSCNLAYRLSQGEAARREAVRLGILSEVQVAKYEAELKERQSKRISTMMKDRWNLLRKSKKRFTAFGEEWQRVRSVVYSLAKLKNDSPFKHFTLDYFAQLNALMESPTMPTHEQLTEVHAQARRDWAQLSIEARSTAIPPRRLTDPVVEVQKK